MMNLAEFYNKPDELDFPDTSAEITYELLEKLFRYRTRFIPAEKNIIKDIRVAFNYYTKYFNRDIYKHFEHQDWPEAEDLFSTDAKISLYYAMQLNKRFLKGEKAIASNEKTAKSYNDMFGTNL